jgi:hypothetical protein
VSSPRRVGGRDEKNGPSGPLPRRLARTKLSQCSRTRSSWSLLCFRSRPCWRRCSPRSGFMRAGERPRRAPRPPVVTESQRARAGMGDAVRPLRRTALIGRATSRSSASALTDRYGRRKLFMVTLGIYVVPGGALQRGAVARSSRDSQRSRLSRAHRSSSSFDVARCTTKRAMRTCRYGSGGSGAAR